MTETEVIEYATSLADASADNPFPDIDGKVLRHSDTGKWFGLILTAYGRRAVNLKCNPALSEFLRRQYEDVIPSYHMNKTHWNTVFLGGGVPDEELKKMIDHSYALTAKKERKKGCSPKTKSQS